MLRLSEGKDACPEGLVGCDDLLSSLYGGDLVYARNFTGKAVGQFYQINDVCGGQAWQEITIAGKKFDSVPDGLILAQELLQAFFPNVQLRVPVPPAEKNVSEDSTVLVEELSEDGVNPYSW